MSAHSTLHMSVNRDMSATGEAGWIKNWVGEEWRAIMALSGATTSYYNAKTYAQWEPEAVGLQHEWQVKQVFI